MPDRHGAMRDSGDSTHREFYLQRQRAELPAFMRVFRVLATERPGLQAARAIAVCIVCLLTGELKIGLDGVANNRALGRDLFREPFCGARSFGFLSFVAPFSHDIHRTGRMTHNGLGNAPEQPLFDSGMSVGAYDYEIGAPLFGFVNDHRLRIAPPNLLLGGQAAGAEPVGKTSSQFISDVDELLTLRFNSFAGENRDFGSGGYDLIND